MHPLYRNEVKMMFCPKCGSEVQDGMRFCIRCGMKLQQDREKNGPIQETSPVYLPVHQVETKTSGKDKKNILVILLVVALVLALLSVIIAIFVMMNNRSRGNRSKEEAEQETRVAVTTEVDSRISGDSIAVETYVETEGTTESTEIMVTGAGYRIIKYAPGYLPAMAPLPVTQRMTTESSSLKEEGAVHHAFMAFDLKTETSWQDGGITEVGEYVQVDFNSPQTFNTVLFHAGNFHTEELFYDNTVPTRFTMNADGTDYDIQLDDSFTAKAVIFDVPVTAKRVRFTVTGFRPGAKYNDTCISEITFYSGDINSAGEMEPTALALSEKKYEAGEWVQEGGRWRFKATDGNYLRNNWFWLDANMDRVAEAYHFDANGYLDTDKGVGDTTVWDDEGTIYVDSAGVAKTFSGYYGGTMDIWTVTMPDCPYTIKKVEEENGTRNDEFEYRLVNKNGYDDPRVFDSGLGRFDEYGNAIVIYCISPFMKYYPSSAYGCTARRDLIPSLDKGIYFEIPVKVIMDYSEDSLNFFITAYFRFNRDCVIQYEGEYGLKTDTLENYLAQDYYERVGNFMHIEAVDSRGYVTRIHTYSAD